MARNSSKSKRRYDVTGFTLVELVVTIAVLAVLSGIGALGYSGYITKANEAADQVLIGAVNEAFASACEEQGVDRMSLPIKTGAKLDPSASPAIKGISSVFGLSGDDLTKFQAAFSKYFEGNEETQLKALSFDDIGFADGVFVSDITSAVTNHAKQVFQGSNFNNDVEGLVESVENVTSLFAQFAGTPGAPLNNRLALLGILGVDIPTTVKALEKYGINDDSTGTEVANAMVLYVAEATNAVEDPSKLVENVISGDIEEDAILKLPMMVGMYTSYYNSSYASQAYKESYDAAMKKGGSAILGLKPEDDPNFNTYKETEMRTDLEGYLAALTLVDQNKDSVNIKDPNAFSNKDFMDLIKSVLGN